MRILIIGFGNLTRTLVNLLCEAKKGLHIPTLFPEINKYDVQGIELAGIVDVREKILEKISSDKCVQSLLKNDLDKIYPGLLLDDVPKHMNEFKDLSIADVRDFTNFLKQVNADIAILSINSFAKKTAIKYAVLLAEHQVSLINTTPIEIAWNDNISRIFKVNNAGVIGDYIRGYVSFIDILSILERPLRTLGFDISSLYILERRGGIEGFSSMRDKHMYIEKMRELLLEIFTPLETSYALDWKRFLKDDIINNIILDLKNPLSSLELSISMKLNESLLVALMLIDLIRALKIAINNGYFGRIEEICQYGFLFTKKHERDFFERINAFKRFLSKFS